MQQDVDGLGMLEDSFPFDPQEGPWTVVGCLVVGSLGLLVGFGVITIPSPRDRPDHQLELRYFSLFAGGMLIAIGVLLVSMDWYIRRLEIRVFGNGVQVRNGRRQISYRWQDITELTLINPDAAVFSISFRDARSLHISPGVMYRERAMSLLLMLRGRVQPTVVLPRCSCATVVEGKTVAINATYTLQCQRVILELFVDGECVDVLTISAYTRKEHTLQGVVSVEDGWLLPVEARAQFSWCRRTVYRLFAEGKLLKEAKGGWCGP